MSQALSDFNNELKDYLVQVRKANNEATKAYFFLEFIRKVFKRVNIDLAERAFPELEHYLKFNKNTIVVKGKIDVLLPNLLIEFKDELDEVKIRDAFSQLQKYIFILYKQEKRINYYSFISDGDKIITFLPRIIEEPASPAEITLDHVDQITLSEAKSEEAYLWIDRYLLYEPTLIPTTKNFPVDFGVKSLLFKNSLEQLTQLFRKEKNQFNTVYNEWSSYLGVVYGSKLEDETLFLKHTYLATLAKLMVYQIYTEGKIPYASIKKIINGSFFRELGIVNFIDEDFFSWVGRFSEGLDIIWSILKVLARYDITKIDEDILKELYQELVDPAERHDLGEFYTPDWLAELMVERSLTKNPKAKVLDPTCGSGTFLVASISFKKKNVKTSPKSLLEHIVESVHGIDVHPLAVIISRANYLLALGSLVREGRAGKLVIPVYLTDSINTPFVEHGGISIPVFEKKIDSKNSLLLPLIEEADDLLYDLLIESLKSFAVSYYKQDEKFEFDEFQSFIVKQVPAIAKIKKRDQVLHTLFNTVKTLIKLIKENHNHIWAFILKNFYKPVILKEKFDVVIGNPPWLSYRYIRTPEYQSTIKEFITERYLLVEKAELITQMDLSTLFFVRCSDLFLKPNGTINFVMPRSVYSSDQHDAFRQQKYNATVSLVSIIDLEKVLPLFRVPSCVIEGKKSKQKSLIKLTKIKAKLEYKNENLNSARKKLQITRGKLYLNQTGGRSFFDEQKNTAKMQRSEYYASFRQGATLVPRSFWFIEIEKHAKFGLDKKAPFIKTSQKAIKNAKEPYQNVRLEGQIESGFLFSTLTGSELIPFGFTETLPLIIPIHVSKNRLSILNKDEAKANGFIHLYSWLENAENIWEKKRGEKSEKLTIYQRINYSKGIENQKQGIQFRVLYNTSGTYLASTVFDLQKNTQITIGGQKIKSNGFIADAKVYYYETNNEQEAYYLSAILNSPALDELIKPMQSKGSFGERDIHKKPFEFPIPKFDSSNKNHLKLARLSKICHEQTAKELPTLLKKYKNLGKIRSAIREFLKKELEEINLLTIACIHSKPKQTAIYTFF